MNDLAPAPSPQQQRQHQHQHQPHHFEPFERLSFFSFPPSLPSPYRPPLRRSHRRARSENPVGTRAKSKMNIQNQRLSTASFVLDTLSQSLVLLADAEDFRSSPSSMYAAFAPHPYAPLLLLVVGVAVQIVWMLKFFPEGFFEGEKGLPGMGRGGGKAWDEEAETGMEERKVEDSNGETIFDVPDDGDLDDGVNGRDDHGARSTSRQVSIDIERQVEMMKEEEQFGDEEQFIGQDYREPNEFENTLEPSQQRYLPFYTIGSLIQATWATTYLLSKHTFSTPILGFNILVQLVFLFKLMGTCTSPSSRFGGPFSIGSLSLGVGVGGVSGPSANLSAKSSPLSNNPLTSFIIKSRIALSVLWMWKSWGLVESTRAPTPSPTSGTLTVLLSLFLSLPTGPSPTLGLLLAFVYLSLAWGRQTQSHDLGWYLLFNWSGVLVFLATVGDWVCGRGVRRWIGGMSWGTSSGAGAGAGAGAGYWGASSYAGGGSLGVGAGMGGYGYGGASGGGSPSDGISSNYHLLPSRSGSELALESADGSRTDAREGTGTLTAPTTPPAPPAPSESEDAPSAPATNQENGPLTGPGPLASTPNA